MQVHASALLMIIVRYTIRLEVNPKYADAKGGGYDGKTSVTIEFLWSLPAVGASGCHARTAGPH